MGADVNARSDMQHNDSIDDRGRGVEDMILQYNLATINAEGQTSTHESGPNLRWNGG